MKITSVDIMQVDAGAPANRAPTKPVYCRIHTSEGIFGDGEAGLMLVTGRTASYNMLVELSTQIIGLDPLAGGVIVEQLRRQNYLGLNGGPIVSAAIAAIDMALWDIKGKFFGVPVYRLLGGAYTESLRCYASQINYGWGDIQEDTGTPEGFAIRALEAVAQGYDAFKADFSESDEKAQALPRSARTGFLSEQHLQLVEARVAAVREAIGPNRDIIMECHGFTDTTTFMQIARRVSGYNIMYFEEPTTAYFPTLERIQGLPDVRIALGERLHSWREFFPLVTRQLIQVAQPDLGNCGGITECVKIADLAHQFDIGMQLHCANSPICTAATLQVEAAIPNFLIHEHCCVQERDYVCRLAKYDYQPVNGRIEVPQLPGMGNELSDYALSHCERTVIE